MQTIKVLSGGYKGSKTLRHVWLDAMSHCYVAFNNEEVLIRELPGYVPLAMDTTHEPSQSGSDSPTMKKAVDGDDVAALPAEPATKTVDMA
jgi:hypothetical protein